MPTSRRTWNVPRVQAIPPVRGVLYVCPACESVIPTRQLITLAKPLKYQHLLADILRCCWCNFYFCYTRAALTAVRDEDGEVIGTALRG